MKYETQRIALLYFAGALGLFVLQVVAGAIAGSTSIRISFRKFCRSTSPG